MIFRIEDRYAEGQATYEEVENEINERLIDAADERQGAHVSDQAARRKRFWRSSPAYVDSGAAPGKDTSWKDVAQLKPQTVTKEEVAAHQRRKRLLFAIPVPGTGDKKPPASKHCSDARSASASATPDAALLRAPTPPLPSRRRPRIRRAGPP